MKSRVSKLLAVAIVTVALVGCGGGIGALLQLIRAGDVVASIHDGLFGPDDSGEATVYLNGQPIAEISEDNAQLQLRSVPAGRHRIHVIASDYRGATSVFTVVPDSSAEIELHPFVGGQIAGRVSLAGGAGAARALVYAVPEWVEDFGSEDSMQLPGSQPPYAAYTDANGNYELSALQVGTHLVIATVAGYMADMQLVAVGERDTVQGVDLTLQADPNADAGRVTGLVESRRTGSLPNASLRAQLAGAPYVPDVPQETVDRITGEAGTAQLPEFRFTVLSTLTRADGIYRLPLVAGSWEIDCFRYGYRAVAADIEVREGAATTADFRLEEY